MKVKVIHPVKEDEGAPANSMVGGQIASYDRPMDGDVIVTRKVTKPSKKKKKPDND